MREVKIGMLGLGTVGQAVLALNQNFDGVHYHFSRALVRDPKKTRAVSIPLTQDPEEIIHDPAIDIVVEVMGGCEPARAWISDALRHGKAVVTANKEVMAYHGRELLTICRSHQAFLGYEAGVGGGIPILDSLRYQLNAAPVQQVYGVLNGTTNYLLCAMGDGRPLEEAIRDAQAEGYAEANPNADVQGWDSARKLVLLAHLAFDQWMHPETFPVVGIDNWPATILSRLKAHGMTLRLVATAKRLADGSLEAQVKPTVVPIHHALGQVTGAQNGIGIITSAGHFWVQGPGAGGLATATSIWADIRRSQAMTPSPMHQAPEVRVALTATFPLMGIALDPDRHLTGSLSGRSIPDPSLAYYDPASSPLEGVTYFPVWE